MPEENFTYAKAGVDRSLRAESKKALEVLRETYSLSRYGEIIQFLTETFSRSAETFFGPCRRRCGYKSACGAAG